MTLAVESHSAQALSGALLHFLWQGTLLALLLLAGAFAAIDTATPKG